MSHDPEVLGVMLNCLNSADAGEVQFELIEATERFPDHVYVREVLPRAKQLVEQAGDWGWMVIQTLLNTNSCLECALLEFSKLDKDTKKIFESVLSELCDRDPSYAERRLMFVG